MLLQSHSRLARKHAQERSPRLRPAESFRVETGTAVKSGTMTVDMVIPILSGTIPVDMVIPVSSGIMPVDTFIPEEVAPRGFEDENLDRQVGIDVVVAHERHHLASGEFLHGADRLGLDGVLKGAGGCASTTSALPSPTRLSSPFAQRSPPRTHTTMFSPIVVRALVGPRPV